jgi:phosphoribosylanthranilate isomerase
MSLTFVKICGVTRVADAQLAAELGARAVGLVFAAKSARRISLDQAKVIASILPATVDPIGVFTSSSEAAILNAIEVASLKGVQVDRDLTSAFYIELKKRGIKVLRSVAVSENVLLPKVGSDDVLLFDSPRDGLIRQSLNIEALKKINPSRPFFIAGGLNAENIGLNMSELRPNGVDLSSGVESSPGVKSARALKDFFTALRVAGGAL